YTLTSIDENIDFELYTSLIELHVLNITYNNYSQSADTMHNFVTYGEDFYAEPNIPTGYKIDSVLVNNKRQLTGIGLGSNYNFDSVRGDSVIVYYVSRKLITITTEIINLTDTLDIAYGDSFRFTYSIPQYYKIDSIVINSQKLNPTPVDSTTGYTIKNIIDNIDFKLYVSKISLIVTTSTIDRNDTFSVAFGDKLVINTIKMGYKLDSIYLNTLKVPNGQDSLRTFTLVNIMTNYNVKLYYSYIFSNKNYDIVNTSNVCINTSNGAVNVSVLDTNLVYTAILTGISVTFKDTNIINKTKSTQYTNLQSGTYRLVLSVTDPTNVIHKDSFVITIGQPQPLTAYSEINNLNKHVLLNLNGAETYYIKLNGVVMSTQNTSLNLPLEKGVNVLSISSNLTCQDEIKQTILISEDMMVYPNPANQYINLYIAGSDEVTDIQIIDEAGKVFKNSTENIPSNRILNFDISQYHQGIYLITIKGKSAFGQLKFVKTK
ncbi:MAG: T9SS type A sorting domain-containing protein, partial [Alphaproteobacteria bacterium]|nr:T9SS type A sorting domain-containing protein [Alphaproteobacteria bacterium]